MKNLISILLFFVGVSCYSQVKVPYDSTYKTTHDTSSIVKVLQAQLVTHDTIVGADSIKKVSVTHDTLVKRKFRRGFKTVSTTHDSSYLVIFSKISRTTHDTLFWFTQIQITKTTHDTTVIKYRDSVIKTSFGASGPTIDGVATLQFVCGKPSVTREATIIKSYSGGGDKGVEKYINAGVPCFWNLNWGSPTTVNGQKQGEPFPTDLAEYKRRLDQILAYYANHPKKDLIILVCENEPTTDNFHDGPMSDYINELKAFVSVAKKYGYKYITDGGVHIGTILGANDGDPNSTNKSSQVAYLLSEYAKIPELTYINAHTANTGGSYNSSDIVRADQKCFSITGRHIWSNEWHATNATALVQIAKGWLDAGAKYSIYISGTNDAYILNNGTNLTSFGTAYKNFISGR